MATDKALVGASGVHYVAFQLSSRRHAVDLTAPGVKGVDLVVADAETGATVNIQVKTMTGAHMDIGKPAERWKWRVGKQLAEGHRHKNFFVAFVDLRGGPPDAPDVSWDPDVFIVRSAHLDKYVWGFPDEKPRDFWFVMPVKEAYKYSNRWDQIEEALS